MTEKALATKADLGGLGGFDESSLTKAVKSAEVKHGTATADSIRDGLGNQAPKLERVKVKHGGACIFQFEDESRADELLGIIVAHTYKNVFFSKSFEEFEEGDRPDCFSRNGQDVAEGVEEPQAARCAVCPRNRNAPDKEARELAFDRPRKETCGNYLTLAVALPGRDIPVQIQFSQSAFKPFAAYVQKIGTQGRFQPHEVATRIKLQNRRGAGGSEYSVPEFAIEGPLPEELMKAFDAQAPAYRALLRQEAEATKSGSDAGEAKQALKEAKAAQKKAAEKGAAL